MSDFNSFVASIWKFNKVAGNFDKVDNNKIGQQISLIKEELDETLDAYINEDNKEVLDGCLDILVTAIGLYQMLNVRGMAVGVAFDKVCRNNDSKLIPAKDFHLVQETRNMYAEQGIETVSDYDSAFNYFVVKNMSGKVLKPKGFVPVDLSDCV